MDDNESRLIVGGSNPELNSWLSHELDAFNVAASGDDSQRSLSVEGRADSGDLVGGLMGWTWGSSAGVEMLWVDQNYRRGGWGARLMAAAEGEARSRGCSQLFVSSFTFQAPDFYRQLGYQETETVLRDLGRFYEANGYPAWAREAAQCYGDIDELDGSWGRSREAILAKSTRC